MEFRASHDRRTARQITQKFSTFLKIFVQDAQWYFDQPHAAFLYKEPKSIGKVNKPCLLSLFILPIDFWFLCSFNNCRKAV